MARFERSLITKLEPIEYIDTKGKVTIKLSATINIDGKDLKLDKEYEVRYSGSKSSKEDPEFTRRASEAIYNGMFLDIIKEITNE